MMKLIVTNDGVYGVDNGKNITWFYSAAEAFIFGSHHKKGWIEEEFMKAIDECRRHGHDCAEFGIYGTMMYTYDSEAASEHDEAI